MFIFLTLNLRFLVPISQEHVPISKEHEEDFLDFAFAAISY